MFYPADSLRRGGRFYLCWVADSWPSRFAAITHRQLWSQDIRKLCDDLLKVMNNESGRPSNRFSLRLSSQLLRGLVRLYERKATVFLGDMCMIHANIFKSANKKFHIRDIVVVGVTDRLVQQPTVLIQELPEDEPRVEEMIQNSGNVVANIQDITLKECALPEFQLPPNDGFGEEHPDQAFQLFANRTMEQMMLQPDVSVAQHSGLDLPLDTTDKSHDKSRMAPHDVPQMERISEHDVTMFRKSTAEGLLLGDFEKDIPEIPEIPLPEMPAPEPEKEAAKQQEESMSELTKDEEELAKDAQEPTKDVPEPTKEKEPVEIELEELQEQPQAKRRRHKAKLIVDKKIKISASVLRARIDNPAVDLRCEDSSQDIVDVRVPWDIYARRLAHAGARPTSRVAGVITRLFQRNLGAVGKRPQADEEWEEVLGERTRLRTRSALAPIVETEEINITRDLIAPPTEAEFTRGLEIPIEADFNKELRASVQPMDMSDLPTQTLKRLSQQSQQRGSGEMDSLPKRGRMSGYISFRESRQLPKEVPELLHYDQEKENVPPGVYQLPPTKHDFNQVSTMLQEAGLSDMQPARPETEPEARPTQGKRRDDREGSETPLGSLDRTKVSLGDSVNTTDSQRFIRNHWGVEGTMVKIVSNITAGISPVTVESLVAKGPVLVDYKRIIAARCFSSILKLKQHGFIKITKHPDSLAIQDIALGPRFDSLQ